MNLQPCELVQSAGRDSKVVWLTHGYTSSSFISASGTGVLGTRLPGPPSHIYQGLTVLSSIKQRIPLLPHHTQLGLPPF